ncbi:MAG: hypothetical protein WBC91_09470 [Phototrophicaceae bacterium]
MTSLRTIISLSWLLLFSVWIATAQGECALDVEAIIERVTEECADIGENEVCYGNRNVSVTPRLNLASFEFDSPGDRADLYNIQSLVVDAVDAQADTWGVAQMRLLVGSDRGLQDITMLLFGEFDLENAVPDTATLDLRVTTVEKTIYLAPNTQTAQVGIVQAGTILTGLARLEDSSWLRIEDPTTRIVGWIENGGIISENQALSTGILPIQAADAPYFGAMQAFYFESGNTDIGCDTVESDGLLIQTPEGEARISLLINEVSIELVGGRNAQGENESGTALIQANQLNGQNLSVNVFQGQANVATSSGTQSVTSGQRTSIPLSVDLRSPVGAPQEPVQSSSGSITIAPLLPAVSAPRQTSNNNSGNSVGNVAVNTTGGGSNNSSSSSSGSGGINFELGGNGSGDNTSNTTTGSGSGSGNGGSSSGSGSGGITFTTGSSSTSDSSGSSTSGLPSSTGSSTEDDAPLITDNIFQGFGQQGNLIALGLAIGAMVALIVFIVRAALREKK